MLSKQFIKTFLLSATIICAASITNSVDAQQRRRAADRVEDVIDRKEDRRDHREDVRDRREDVRDARHNGGILDRLEDVRDYSSSRGGYEGNIVNQVVLSKGGNTISFFMKGLSHEIKEEEKIKKTEYFETFYFDLARLLGLNSAQAAFYHETR